MEPLWPVLLFAAVHVFIVYNVASVNSQALRALLKASIVAMRRQPGGLYGARAGLQPRGEPGA